MAQLTAVYLNSQKLNPPYYSPMEVCLFSSQRDNAIPTWICDAFIGLLEEGLLPSWVIDLSPIDELQSGSSEHPARLKAPRLWIAFGVAIIAPKIAATGLKIGLACWDGKGAGLRQVWDVDTGSTYQIVIPESIKAGAFVEPEWELIQEDEDE